MQLHQANRNEEALDLLFTILRQDLGAEDGKIKQEFLSILAAIGNNDPVTNKYRRLLYSLLYWWEIFYNSAHKFQVDKDWLCRIWNTLNYSF